MEMNVTVEAIPTSMENLLASKFLTTLAIYPVQEINLLVQRCVAGKQPLASIQQVRKVFVEDVPISHSAQNDVRTIPSIPKFDTPGKNFTQIQWNLRDMNLKGSLDLCGNVCTDDSEPCNVDKEQWYNRNLYSIDFMTVLFHELDGFQFRL